MDHQTSHRGVKKTIRDKWKWKHSMKHMGQSKSSSLREFYSDTSLHQERRKMSNKQTNLHLKQLEKEQIKLGLSRRKEIIKIREEINEIDTKKLKWSIKLKPRPLKSFFF